MVSDVRWHGFGATVEGVTAASLVELRKVYPRVIDSFNPLLSVVMPGHEIATHRDAQPPDWVGRVHVPLFTNDKALMRIDGGVHHMAVGYAYLVDTTREHAVENFGDAPRVHYMFDVRFG